MRVQLLPQSSERNNPRQPTRYICPAACPCRSARTGLAPAGAGTRCHVLPSSERTTSRSVAARICWPSEASATANTGPRPNRSGATSVQSSPPFDVASSPLSVPSSSLFDSAGSTAIESAPLTSRPWFAWNHVTPRSRLRNSPPQAPASCACALGGAPASSVASTASTVGRRTTRENTTRAEPRRIPPCCDGTRRSNKLLGHARIGCLRVRRRQRRRNKHTLRAIWRRRYVACLTVRQRELGGPRTVQLRAVGVDDVPPELRDRVGV